MAQFFFNLEQVDVDYVIELFDLDYDLNFEDAEELGKITEWELLQILRNSKYYHLVLLHESEDFNSPKVEKIKHYLSK